MKTSLHDHLADTYPLGPPSRRKAPPPTIRVDDQHDGDEPSLFCSLSVTEVVGDEFKLVCDHLPVSPEVEDLVANKAGILNRTATGAFSEVRLTVRDSPYLRQLAKAIRRLVGRGQRYSDANWKWICPRTAASLERLADTLLELRRLRRQAAPTRR